LFVGAGGLEMIKIQSTFKKASLARVLILLYSVFLISQSYADGSGTLTLQGTSEKHSLSVVDAVVALYSDSFLILLFDQPLNAEERKTPYKKLKSKAAGEIELKCEGNPGEWISDKVVRKCRVKIRNQPSGFSDLSKEEFKLSGYQFDYGKSYSTTRFYCMISGKSKENTEIDRYLRPVRKYAMTVDVSIKCSSLVPVE
jgi:hypothetical protein